MADPTIQTFCCHHQIIFSSNISSISSANFHHENTAVNLATAEILLRQFHSLEYNIVCLLCAIVGIAGAVYQILPRQQTGYVQACRGRDIISWLATADLMASLGVFVRSAVWLLLGSTISQSDSYRSTIFCAVSAGWTQYFYTCTWFWTLAYAIDIRRALKGRTRGNKLWAHALCWSGPAFLTSAGLVVLYAGADENCQGPYAALKILPTFCVTYVPILLVMIVNPLLYFESSKDVLRILTLTSGQLTNKERSATNSVTLKFFLINVAFYICWLPNLLNGILLWTLRLNIPASVISILWYIMAVTNPLQAAFNALVYRQKRGSSNVILKFPCCINEPDSNFRAETDESTPLVETRCALNENAESAHDDFRPYWSVNNSCSYL